MCTCFGKLIIGVTGLLVGSAELADGTRKRKTLSVALGLLTALASIVLLFVSLYQWANGDDEEEDEEEIAEEGETSAPEAEAEPAPKPEEPAPKVEEESAVPAEEESMSAQEDAE